MQTKEQLNTELTATIAEVAQLQGRLSTFEPDGRLQAVKRDARKFLTGERPAPLVPRRDVEDKLADALYRKAALELAITMAESGEGV